MTCERHPYVNPNPNPFLSKSLKGRLKSQTILALLKINIPYTLLLF